MTCPQQLAGRCRLIASLVLVILWVLLYIPNLRTSPGWYGDEFVSLIAGRSMLDGSLANRSLHYSFFSVFTNYQPACNFLYAVFAAFFSGGDILGARFLSTLAALACAQMAFHMLASRGRMLVGFCAALIFLTAPQSLIHFRWVYPHLFVATGALLAGLLLDRRRTAKRDWLIGLGCAIGALCHLIAVHVTAIATLVSWRRPRSWLAIILPPVAVFLLALAYGYFISGPQLFLDLQEVAASYAGHGGPAPFISKIRNFFIFFSWDWFHLFSLVSLVVVAFQRRWGLFFFTFLIAFAIIQNRPELPVFYYQASIFLPLLCVIQAYTVQAGAVLFSSRFLPPKFRRWFVRGLAVTLSCIFLPQSLHRAWTNSITPRCQYLVTPSIADLENAAAWINEHTKKNDLVIAYWDAGYLLRGRWADIMQAAAWQYGSCQDFYPRPRTKDEFIFPANLKEAKYVVVGPLDLQFAYSQGTAPQLVQMAKLADWPQVWNSPTVTILRNPKYPDEGRPELGPQPPPAPLKDEK